MSKVIKGSVLAHIETVFRRKIDMRIGASIALVVALCVVFLLSPISAQAEFGMQAKWGSHGVGDGWFMTPASVSVDPSGNVYVADSGNHRIQKFDSNGNYLSKWGSIGNAEGQFRVPQGVTADSSGNVYVVDLWGARVQKFDSNGTFQVMWGWGVDNGSEEFQVCTGSCEKGIVGIGNGQFVDPAAIAVDSAGNVYVSDSLFGRIQKFKPTGGTYEYDTKWGSQGTGDGEFSLPSGVTVDSSGNVYIVDTGNDRIQKFKPVGGTYEYDTQWGSDGNGDGQFIFPLGVAVDASGNAYVSDAGNYFQGVDETRIQKFDSNGGFISKWGSRGTGDGQFRYPSDIAVGPSGDIYVADADNHRIQKFGEVPTGVPPPNPPKPPEPLGDIELKTACILKITSPKIKTKRQSARAAAKRKSEYEKISAKASRSLFTRGVKGYFQWGHLNGKTVKCKKIKMAVLQKRGKRYYIPGTKTRVPKKYLAAKTFPTKGISFLKKKKVGKLRQRRVTSKEITKFSFKDFNRKSKYGRRALNKLKKQGYSGTFAVIYSAEIDGKTIKRTIFLKAKKK